MSEENKKEEKKKVSNLGKHLGQFSDPAVRAKALETQRRNREEKRKKAESVKDGFSLSKLSDPLVQAELIDDLLGMWRNKALDLKDRQWALKQLSAMNAINQPNDKVEEAVEEKVDAKDTVAYLKQVAGKK